MADSNAFLQSIVRDAQTVCLEKFNLAATTLGPTNPDVKAVKMDLDRIFGTLSQPTFWINTIDADGTPIVTQVIVLGSVDAGNLDGVVDKIRQTLQLIETEILLRGQASATAADPAPPSDMNTKVLNALRIARQQIAIRLQKFASAGQDLSQDDDFMTMQNRQDALVNSYREKLKKNQIASKQTDVNIIRNNGNSIESAATQVAFLSTYATLSNFIQLKVGTT
jgi:hypothetical protein